MTYIKEIETEILMRCKETGTCLLVCKFWNYHMEARKAMIKKALQENNLLVQVEEYGNLRKLPLSLATDEFYKSCMISLQPYAKSIYKNYFISAKLSKHSISEIFTVKSLKFTNNDLCIVSVRHMNYLNIMLKYRKRSIDDLKYFYPIDFGLLTIFKKELILSVPSYNFIIPFKDCNFIEIVDGAFYYEFKGGIYKTEYLGKREFVKWIPEL